MSPYANRLGSPLLPPPGIEEELAAAARNTAVNKQVAWSPPKKQTGVLWKGKDKAIRSTDDAGARLMPGMGNITYRHFLGNQLNTPVHPLRTIAHVDIDAAYAAMEMARLGIDPATPLAVQQWQGLIAVNYPARKFGITRHETPAEALKKCPHLVMVHCATYKEGDTEPSYDNFHPTPATHKISLDHYRRESLKIIKVFTSHIPTVEKASIDESYLDASPQVREILIQRYPQLGKLPPGKTLDDLVPTPKELGINAIDWDQLGNLIPTSGQKKEDQPREIMAEPKKERDENLAIDPASSTDQANLESASAVDVSEAEEPATELEEPDLTWSDVALSIGAELVQRCRRDVHEQLGYTCSAGLAPNKVRGACRDRQQMHLHRTVLTVDCHVQMLAKLCSAWKKPNAQTVLRCCAVPAFLRPMPFQKIRNLGGKLGISVKEAYDAETVNDLLDYTLIDMQSKLGDDSGLWLWEIIRGLDFGEVEPKTHVKSMLSSKNFRPTISKFKEVVSTPACHWMNILATELHLRLCEARRLDPSLWPKTVHFSHRSPSYVIRTHQIPFPYTSQLSIPYIAKHADKLLRLAIPDRLEGLNEHSLVGPWSNIQLSFAGLGKKEEGVGGIEKFLMGAPGVAGLAAARTDEKRPMTTKEPSKQGLAKKRKKDETPQDLGMIELSDDESTADENAEEDDGEGVGVEELAWTCSKCTKVLSAKDDTAMAKAKAEHKDYHFARSMIERERQQGRDGGATVLNNVKLSQARGAAAKLNAAAGKAKKQQGSSSGSMSTKTAPKEEVEKGQKTLKGFFGR
ncbi:BQ5605_C016g08290 [Microbotryum silenes-dioicae]|uniref:BQ5605_C016g08290 protein n=1 Tax=Microbotryum silenes-dioicae TaxID=796604 RepID=A0A2X0NZ94_9BASI|nr:BQ5605_C016g08290 [Microbotryum silenes-dioicae]